MLTIEQWTTYMDKAISWEHAYPIVANEAKKFLDTYDGPSLYTSALTELICPTHLARGQKQLAACDRVAQALRKLSKHQLKNYARIDPGKASTYFGRTYHWITWNRPGAHPKHNDPTADYWKGETK